MVVSDGHDNELEVVNNEFLEQSSGHLSGGRSRVRS